MKSTASAFTGTFTLARLALRRDRIQLPIWLIAIALLQFVTIASTIDLYGEEAERVDLAKNTAKSAVGVIFNGLVSGTSLGATVTTQSLLLVLIAAAFMSYLAVVRHTRQNEETGRAELIGAGVVGRYASLTAALMVVVGANIALGAVNVLALLANDLPLAGSLATGAAVAAVGITFAGIAAVTAQISESARAANGLAASALGVAFLLRALGDSTGKVTEGGTNNVSSWPSWLSPLGWGQQVRPFDTNEWWIVGLVGVVFAILVALAFTLIRHRDLGTGMLPIRPGPASAAPSLLSPLGLAWRLQRGVFLGWAIGMTILGVAYGAIGNEVDDFIGDSDDTAELIKDLGGGADLTDAFFGAMLGMLGIAVAGYAIQAVLRLRSEESTGPLEPLLATSVSRYRWALSHLAIAGAGTVAILALTGFALGLTYGLTVGEPGHQAASLTVAALARVPATLAMAAAVVAIFGLLPRAAAALAWAGLAVCLVIGWLGVLLKFPQPVLDLSPFSHTPNAPVDDVTWLPITALLAVTIGLTAAGLALFRRRDLALS